jgi:hypothetical protein
MRRTIALLLLVGACTHDRGVDSGRVESKLAELFEQQLQVKADSVDCPGGKLEGKVTCTARAIGMDVELNVHIFQGAGGIPVGGGDWKLESEAVDVLSGVRLAESMKPQLEKMAGTQVLDVTCPPLLKETPVMKFACVAHTAQGNRMVAAESRGGQISFHFQ